MPGRNNNFIHTKKNLNYLIVKVPHLTKKIRVLYSKSDSVSDFIEKIQVLIDDRPLNYGIFVKSKSDSGNFVSEQTNLVNILHGEKKILYCKKQRIFHPNLNVKKNRNFNESQGQILFNSYLSNNDVNNVLQMLQNGFDPNYLIEGESPLHRLILHKNATVLMSILISHGAHVDYRTNENISVLHRAIKHSRSDIVKLLLEFGLCPDIVDSSNMTPLNYSILHNNDAQCFRNLLQFNAKLNIETHENMHEIHQASYYNKLEHLKELVEFNQDINLQTKAEGNTPLHCAIFGNALNCIKYLLEIEVKTDIRNVHGLTPVDIVKMQFPDIIYLFDKEKILKKSSIDVVDDDKLNGILKLTSEPNIFHDHIISSVQISNITEGTKSEKYSTSKILDHCSKTSSTSVSILESSNSISKNEMKTNDFFGIKTKVIELTKSEDSFGFSLETDITDENYLLSFEKPSIHRICKWKSLSIKIPLNAKPFLLEVNNVSVGDMNHGQLAGIIKSSPNPIKLRITDHMDTKPLMNNSLDCMNSQNLDDNQSIFLEQINEKRSSLSNDTNKICQGVNFLMKRELSHSCISTPFHMDIEQVLTKGNLTRPNYLFPKSSLDSFPSIIYDDSYLSCHDNKSNQIMNNLNDDQIENLKVKCMEPSSHFLNNDHSLNNFQGYEKLHRSVITVHLHKSEYHSSEIFIPLEFN